MPGLIELFMSEDHVRLDALLAASERPDGTIDAATHERFRAGLLRHIGMEEKVLIPFITQKRGSPPPVARQLRVDHGKIAKLLVPTPTAELCAELRAVLGVHNGLEEGEGGLYAICDALGEPLELDALMRRLDAQPEVPLAKHYDGPLLARSR